MPQKFTEQGNQFVIDTVVTSTTDSIYFKVEEKSLSVAIETSDGEELVFNIYKDASTELYKWLGNHIENLK